MMLIYLKYEIVRYCLLCEKVQIVWSHFKSVQDEYVHSVVVVFLVCKDICKQFGRQSSSHIKAGFLLSLAFHNKRQLYCGFYTVQTLEDVRRPLKVIC